MSDSTRTMKGRPAVEKPELALTGESRQPPQIRAPVDKLDVPAAPSKPILPHNLAMLDDAKIDSLDAAGLRDAIKSVVRSPDGLAMHRDHRSHSSSVQ
jgi:hypothetical protein